MEICAILLTFEFLLEARIWSRAEEPGRGTPWRAPTGDFFSPSYALGYYRAPLTGLLTRGRIVSTLIASW
jgi:hypothetical protein